MKIICPEHNGPIEVLEKDIIDAFNHPTQSMIFHCPVCNEKVLIRNIQIEKTSMFSLKQSLQWLGSEKLP